MRRSTAIVVTVFVCAVFALFFIYPALMVIGEAFSRNHATILYANDQVSKKSVTDRGLQQTLAILKDKVQKNSVNSVQ